MVKRKDKRGVMGIILLFLIFFTLLIIGFAAALLTGVLDYTSDTITPVMEDLGMAGNTNLSQASQYSFGVVDNFVQAMPWLVTFGYVVSLIFTVVFVVSYGYNPHPALIGFYFGFIILLIFGAIIISNMYQDIYEGDDEIATRLKENTSMSYMVLYSPFIFAVLAFIVGIYLFSTSGREGGGISV